uniref:Uncharacterized protein n=1 Tax=Panagrolaimus sp. JU765 TaxID=591449 RepID=A0AC34PU81_9BILA
MDRTVGPPGWSHLADSRNNSVENVPQYLHDLLKDAFLSGDFDEYTKTIQNEDKPQAWETWVVGLSILTISAISSPLGILLVPLLSKALYDRFMTFLVALGIGAMSGSVLFILLPQAFAITELESFARRVAKRKIHASTLKSVIKETKEQKKKRRKQKKQQTKGEEEAEREKDDLRQEFEVQMITNNLVRTLSKRKQVAVVQKNKVDEVEYRTSDGRKIDLGTLRHHQESETEDEGSTISTATSTPTLGNTASLPQISINMDPASESAPKDPEFDLSVQVIEKQVIQKPEIANVAYMIIFGTSANNFVDGMSTGAAFSDSLTRGISIGLAVISQQFPQELGTLAILVNSGLGLKRTLLFNVIPILLTYLGFAVGVLLDNINEGYDEYIYSVSSGMYFYIFLGTLLPEIRDSVSESLKTNLPEAFLTTVLQFSGIIFGVTFMYFMSLYGDEG